MPTFNLQLQFDDKGAVASIKRFNEVADAAGRTKDAAASAGRDMGEAFWNVTKKLGALIGAYKALEKAMGFLNRGIELNSSLEQSRIGIATLITSMANLENAQGKALEGAEKYAAAQGLAAEMMAEIQKLGLETTATSKELVEGVQSIMGPALQAGMALKDIPKFAIAGAQAMQTLGIPLNQMRTELEALLSGSVNKSQDILAPKLFADINGDLNEYLKGLKASGTLIDEIIKRLEPFRQAGADVGQTWTGIVNNLEEAVDTVAGIVTDDMLQKMKEAADLIKNMMISEGGGKVGIADDFENIAAVLSEISSELGSLILSLTKGLVSLEKAFNTYLGNDAIGVVDKLKAAFIALAAGIGMTALARCVQALSAFKTSLIQAKDAALINAHANKQAYIEYLKTDEAKRKLRVSTEAVIQSRAKLKALTQQVIAAEAGLNQAMNNSALRSAASAGISQLSKSLTGLVTFLGGPVGAGLTAASVAVTYLALKEDDASKSTRLLTEAQEAYEQTVAKAVDATGRLTRALTDAERKQMEIAAGKALDAWNIKIDEFEKRIASLSVADHVSLANGFTGTLVSSELHNFMDEFDKLVKKLRQDGPQGTEAFNNGLARLLDKIQQSKEANSEFAQYLNEYFSSTEQGTQAFLRAAEAFVKYKDGLQGAVEVSAKGKTALEELIAAMNELEASERANVETAKGAIEWLQKRFEKTEEGKKAQEEMAKATDEAALATLREQQALALLEAQALSVPIALGMATEAQKVAAAEAMKNYEKITALIGKFENAKPQMGASNSVRKTGIPAGKVKSSGASSKNPADDWKELENQLAKLEGRTTGAEASLEKTQKKIEETGKAAKKSAGEIRKMQEAFRQATDTKSIKELNKELLQLEGNTRAVEDIERQGKKDQFKARLSEIKSLSKDEKNILLGRYEQAEQREIKVNNLQTAIDFMKDLESLGDDYGLTVQLQNELLEYQISLFRDKLPPSMQPLIDQWERLKRLQNDKSAMGGLERGLLKFGEEYGDLSKQIENFIVQMGSTIANTLSNAFMTGKFSAQDFFNSLISMAAQAASNYFIGMIFKGLGGMFVGGANYSAAQNATMSANGMQSGYGGWLTGVHGHHKGGIVGKDYTFKRDVPYYVFSDAPRFHSGGGFFRQDEYPAILQSGERVLNRDETRAYQAGISAGSNSDVSQFGRIIAELQSQMREDRQYMGGNMPVINLNIENNSNADVQAGQMKQDGNGGFTMDIIISQVEQGIVGRMKQGKSQIAHYQEQAYGMNRAAVLSRGRGRS